jgi:hypothetical protein
LLIHSFLYDNVLCTTELTSKEKVEGSRFREHEKKTLLLRHAIIKKKKKKKKELKSACRWSLDDEGKKPVTSGTGAKSRNIWREISHVPMRLLGSDRCRSARCDGSLAQMAWPSNLPSLHPLMKLDRHRLTHVQQQMGLIPEPTLKSSTRPPLCPIFC